jgi:hypothetical protein
MTQKYLLPLMPKSFKESKQGGYTWNRTIDLPKVMKRALANQEWLDMVAAIENAANKAVNRSGR